MRTTEEIKKAANVELSRAVHEYFFCDENGYLLSGHPDQLAVSRKKVIEKFPQTARWPIVLERREGTGYVLGSGTYLFPDFDFDKPSFTAI